MHQLRIHAPVPPQSQLQTVMHQLRMRLPTMAPEDIGETYGQIKRKSEEMMQVYGRLENAHRANPSPASLTQMRKAQAELEGQRTMLGEIEREITKRRDAGIWPLTHISTGINVGGIPPRELRNGTTNPEWLRYYQLPPDLYTNKSYSTEDINRFEQEAQKRVNEQRRQRQLAAQQQQVQQQQAQRQQPNLAQMSPHTNAPGPSGAGMATNGPPPALANMSPEDQKALLRTLPPIPPLSEPQFTEYWRQWASRTGTPFGPEILDIDGKQIKLVDLHRVVFSMGGCNRVSAEDKWALVGGQLGWGAFTGPDGQQRAEHRTAQCLRHVYESAVAEFDKIYLHRGVRYLRSK